MANVVNDSNGRKRIQFVASDGGRKTIRLGHASAKQAEMILAKVEAILADKMLGRPHDAEIAKWLSGLDDTLKGRLRAVGLAEGLGVMHTTLAAFMDRFFASLTCKQSARTFYGHTRRCLETFLGAGRALRTVMPADADGWRAWLVQHEHLAPATTSRRIVAARTMWKAAVRWGLAAANPFSGVRAGTQSNESRKYFVSRAVIDCVIEEAADLEWKALIALSRYGGLRCPSEHLGLRWGDVDFHLGRLHVRSPKTEHHEGHGSRVVPLFPELREHLQRLFDEAPEGSQYVIAGTRDSAVNLRTQFCRIIRRAGFAPWPKLWHNLRASRESELMREYDLATVCRWIGNSPAVAAKHYAVSVDLDADFRKATGLDGDNGGRSHNQHIDTHEQEAQKAAQYTAELPRTTSRAVEKTSILRGNAGVCDTLQTPNGPEWSRTIDLVVISDAL